MKMKKKINRFCPFCKKKTEQKVDLVSTGSKRGSLKRGSLTRMKQRNAAPGKGHRGRQSRPAIKKWKRKTKATTRKVIIYKCMVCKKSKHSNHSRRVSKIIIGEKTASE
jgi:large subunit ribosomal protein L44e